VGFSVFLFSDFLLNITFAKLTLIILVTAALFDLVVLPALLLGVQKRKAYGNDAVSQKVY
jgi:predicted RND superfamily exporter protein